MHYKTALAAALVFGLAQSLTACGNDDPADQPAASQTEHNEADVEFAKSMIPHHAQALAMVDMTRGRQLDPPVQELADAIMAAQTPEIESMTDWLTSWGDEVPETSRDHMNAEGHGEMGDMGDMPGMMSEQELSDLDAADDAEFQDMWLEMMIEHHQGAIEMAQTEQSDGQYQPALDLAEDIETAQVKEISVMEKLQG
ncbi:MAG TPA: DUF305 domain-containing protein [Nocardioides sp.]|jgi:uncharacterized protein (DUF305 family)|nr:DUF305 domain-containing protein [Nocardioides sp.]